MEVLFDSPKKASRAFFNERTISSRVLSVQFCLNIVEFICKLVNGCRNNHFNRRDIPSSLLRFHTTGFTYFPTTIENSFPLRNFRCCFGLHLIFLSIGTVNLFGSRFKFEMRVIFNVFVSVWCFVYTRPPLRQPSRYAFQFLMVFWRFFFLTLNEHYLLTKPP